jgi:hypothetical protein
LREVISCSKERDLPVRPPRPDPAVGLEDFDHHLPLGVILPKVPEKLFLAGIVLAYTLKTASDVSGIEGQTQGRRSLS